MTVPDDLFERLGFARAATAIAIRTIATCPTLAFQPLGRPVIGIATFGVVAAGDSYRFCARAQVLRDDALPDTLIDWLDPRLPETGAILAYQHDSLLASLRGVLDTVRHPRVAAFVYNPGDRLRIMPHSLMRGTKRGSAGGMPCLCPRGEACAPQLPGMYLPDPDVTEAALEQEAEALWERWAQHHAAFAGHRHPARDALVALSTRRAKQASLS